MVDSFFCILQKKTLHYYIKKLSLSCQRKKMSVSLKKFIKNFIFLIIFDFMLIQEEENKETKTEVKVEENVVEIEKIVITKIKNTTLENTENKSEQITSSKENNDKPVPEVKLIKSETDKSKKKQRYKNVDVYLMTLKCDK